MQHIPQYTKNQYKDMMESIDPIESYGGYTIKNGDAFTLGPLTGSKVRQCIHIVHANLREIREKRNNGILTGAGLPSPQVAIVAGVAKYFGMRCAVVVPKYDSSKRDFNRINASLASRFGADVYGVRSTYPSGYEKGAKDLVQTLGYHQIKFGMCGDLAMQPVIRQVQNVPDNVRTIVVIGGSGLTAMSIFQGCRRYKKPVEDIHVVSLSGRYAQSKAQWYDPLPSEKKFEGEIHVHPTPRSYQTFYRALDPDTGEKTMKFDLTYESKAWLWMTENIKPDSSVLFWVVGKRVYDMKAIVEFPWCVTPGDHAKQLKQEGGFAI